jgi:hypothetical protein
MCGGPTREGNGPSRVAREDAAAAKSFERPPSGPLPDLLPREGGGTLLARDGGGAGGPYSSTREWVIRVPLVSVAFTGQ